MTCRFRFNLTLILALVIFLYADGYPSVSENEANDHRKLTIELPVIGMCSDPELMEDQFGRFGLIGLPPESIGTIVSNFGDFAPILVRSQAGRYRPSYRIQALFREYATPTQRNEMIRALRYWLTEDISDAPIHCHVQIFSPESAVTGEILTSRTMAAEMLAEWRDIESLPYMKTLLGNPELSDDFRLVVERSVRRFDDPCAIAYLKRAPGGQLACCADSSSLVEGTVVLQLDDEIEVTYKLTNHDLVRVWHFLNDGIYRERREAGGGEDVVTLKLHNGVEATLELCNNYVVKYKDNSTLDPRQEIVITSVDFHVWIDAFQPNWKHPILGLRDKRRSQIQVELVGSQVPLDSFEPQSGGHTGQVDLKVLVGEHGRVKEADAIRSTDPLLENIAFDIANSCLFRPAKWHGESVERWAYLSVVFDQEGAIRLSN